MKTIEKAFREKEMQGRGQDTNCEDKLRDDHVSIASIKSSAADTSIIQKRCDAQVKQLELQLEMTIQTRSRIILS